MFTNSDKHNDAATVGFDVAKPLVRSIKVAASQDVFQPASAIVDKHLKDADLSRPWPALPFVANIIRLTNRYRSAKRQKDPKDLSFILESEHLPADFFACRCSKTRTAPFNVFRLNNV